MGPNCKHDNKQETEADLDGLHRDVDFLRGAEALLRLVLLSIILGMVIGSDSLHRTRTPGGQPYYARGQSHDCCLAV